MEKEKNLNENPAFQELPDESLNAVAGGGGARSISEIKYSYGDYANVIVAKVPREEGPQTGVIMGRTYVTVSNRYYPAYKFRYRSFRPTRHYVTIVIREEDILGFCNAW